MNIKISQAACIVWATLFSVLAYAQVAPNLFGDKDQPGHRLHIEIDKLKEAGVSKSDAIVQAVEDALQDDSSVLNGESKSAVAFDIPHAEYFYVQMVDVNSLIEVTKVLIEEDPAKAVHTITLGVVLYPDYAQEVHDGAVLSGILSPEDVLIATIQAGADPSSVSSTTAADAPEPAAPPIGVGIGAGGTGGGDTTASTN